MPMLTGSVHTALSVGDWNIRTETILWWGRTDDMACRCADIGNVNADLNTLARAEEGLPGLDTAASGIEEATQGLASAVGTAVEVSTASVSSDIYSKGVRDARGKIASDIRAKRADLQSTLKAYQEEDRAYHAEQDRKEAEERQREQEASSK